MDIIFNGHSDSRRNFLFKMLFCQEGSLCTVFFFFPFVLVMKVFFIVIKLYSRSSLDKVGITCYKTNVVTGNNFCIVGLTQIIFLNKKIS